MQLWEPTLLLFNELVDGFIEHFLLHLLLDLNVLLIELTNQVLIVLLVHQSVELSIKVVLPLEVTSEACLRCDRLWQHCQHSFSVLSEALFFLALHLRDDDNIISVSVVLVVSCIFVLVLEDTFLGVFITLLATNDS